MKGKEDEDKDIDNRLPVKTQCPIRFVVFREEEETREDLYPEKDNKRNTTDPMEQPDKHASLE